MKPGISLIGLVCGAVIMRYAGDAIFQHGMKAGSLLWFSNWILATGGSALFLGALDTQLQGFGFIAVTVGATLRAMTDRRRVKGTKENRKAMRASG